MKVDRFDLEQQILKCWNVTEDVDLLHRTLLDGPREMTTDEISNALLGIQTLYEMKFNELFNTFEKLVQEKKIL
jgi:hypothetical protein